MIKSTGLLLIIAITLMAGVSKASDTEHKPFAEKHVVLQISNSDVQKQTHVLNVASNLLKHYGPDKIEIEIVAFGPGLRLLLKDNSNTGRIAGLSDTGVRFAACNNTLTAFTRLLGAEPELNNNAVHVNAGVVRIMDLVDQGYMLVKP